MSSQERRLNSKATGAGGPGSWRGIVAALLVSAVMPMPAARAQGPAGAEFRVNSYTTDGQDLPSVAADANGDFVVVWTGQAESGTAIFGQRFNAAGVAQGAEFQVNSYTMSSQGSPSVASDTNGNFVVVWVSLYQDGSSFGIFGQRFNSAGVAQGAEFQVNSYTTSSQTRSAVASDSNGNFVVVWVSYDQDGSGPGIFGRRFNAAGVAQGAEFQVNSYTTSYQSYPSIAADAAGSFVVVWTSIGQDGDGKGVFGRRFNAAGVAQGVEFQVNSYTTIGQDLPSVAADANGNFVVVWQSPDSDIYGIFGRRFNAAGVAQGAEFQVNSYATGRQSLSSVAADAGGSFVVVWESDGQDGSNSGVFGQRFDPLGAPLGSEFRANSYTTSYQSRTSVATNPDGDFVVVWNSYLQDGSSYGVFGQRYGDLIFQDGFQSGDLSRWSSASTDGGDLSISGAAGLAGTTFGLQAFVNDTNSLFVQDDTPNAENRYRARFYFDTNGFDPGEANSHFRIRILIAQGSGFRVITIVLKRQLGAYSVEARVRRNDGTRADTGFFPISDGPHFVEFDWQRSTAPGASNGSLELWIDGASVATLSGIDNDLAPVDLARMGALAVKTGAAGTLFFDQFESRRQVFIGAE